MTDYPYDELVNLLCCGVEVPVEHQKIFREKMRQQYPDKDDAVVLLEEVRAGIGMPEFRADVEALRKMLQEGESPKPTLH